jgi:hypothetical protein
MWNTPSSSGGTQADGIMEVSHRRLLRSFLTRSANLAFLSHQSAHRRAAL